MIARKHRKGSHVKRKILIIFITVTVLTAAFFEIRLKPIAASVAKTQAQTLATVLINQSVTDVLTEMNITDEQLDTITRTADGAVTSISGNTVLTNKLKSAITLRVQESIVNVRGYRVEVPLGTIIGGELINGRGTGIPIYVSLSGTVESDFISEFESGGVNQTIHKLSVEVKAKITIIMPLSTAETEVKTTVPVSENIIVGSVPSGMIMRD